MIFFILTVVLTLGVSAVCSMLEAMVLSTTPLEIETLKRKSPRRGELLETFVAKIDETSSAILNLIPALVSQLRIEFSNRPTVRLTLELAAAQSTHLVRIL